jgi:gliding motility-associated-like protein
MCVLAACISSFGYGQLTVLMSDATASTCNGILYDTGGIGAAGYQNGEYFVLTICPDIPGDIITLDFLSFALDNTNTAPAPGNNIDNLAIFDGNTTGAASLGVYSGNSLAGLLVSCTTLNTSGCLTLVFTSNSAGTGVFAATITCSTPCQRPEVHMVAPIVPNNPVKICDGETVNFDGSASFAAPGFNIVDYIYVYGDGTTDTLNTPISSHVYNSGPGEYSSNLYVIDDNGCINTNVETIVVQAGTIPTFNYIFSDTTLCLGESVCMGAPGSLGSTGSITGHIVPNTWTGQPVSSLGGATYLPDDVGQCFDATLDFSAFTPGQTLTNVNDLQDLCINMEHSYMGDLVGTITCPNGQNVIFHQQNGGGTFLGDPIDVNDSLQPGDCWQYCFSPTATNGTWVDNSQFGATPNTIPSINNGFGECLAPGTYESLNSLAGLVGCPLNGTWTLEFCDLWGADDGFVCDFSVNFDPSLYPSISTFTPIIGDQCDSSSWNGNALAQSFVVTSSADCNQQCIAPTQAGAFDYTFSVTDDYGCSYDSTWTVTVDPGPSIFAGNDTTVCPGPLQLQALATGGILSAPTCDYTINMYDTWGDGWNGFSVEVFADGLSIGVFTFNTGTTSIANFPISNGQVLDFVTVSGVFDTEVSYEIVDCDGNVIFQDGVNFTATTPIIGAVFNTTAVSNVSPQYNFSWTPPGALTDPLIADPIAAIGGTIQYIVEGWETGHMLCSATDTINIIVTTTGLAGNDTTINFCANAIITDLFTLVPGSPDPGGNWFDAALNPIAAMFDPASQPAGIYAYVVGVGGCSDSSFMTINVAVPFLLDLANDSIVCENGTAVLTTNRSGGLGGPYIETWSAGLIGNAPHNVNPTANTCYTMLVTDAFGCVSQTDSICISLYPPLLAAIVGTDSICPGDPVTYDATAIGGIGAPYTFTWDNGATGSQLNDNPSVNTTYCATVTDACETTPFIICDSVVANLEPAIAFSSDINSGCYPITVNFTNNTPPGSVGSVFWDFGNGSTTANTGVVGTTYPDPICYDVTLTVSSPAGCIATLVQPSMICPDDYPAANFTINPNPTDLNQTAIQFTNLSTDATTYTWDFGPNTIPTTSTLIDPLAEFPNVNPGTYPITLTAFNGAGCSHDTTFNLVINGIFTLYVPTAFSPNGDGINDILKAEGDMVDPDGYEFMIFDRWGTLLWSTDNFTTGWDGKFKTGAKVPTGLYVWRLFAKDLYKGDKYEFKGHVTILK